MERIKYCMKGLEIIPDNPALLEEKYRFEQELLSAGSRFIAEGMPQAVVNISEELFKTDPKSAIAWTMKSAALEKMNNLLSAYDAAQRAIDLDPNIADTHLQMGNVMFAQSKYEQAIKELNKAINLGKTEEYFYSKKHIKALNTISKAYESLGNKQKALEAEQDALSLAQYYQHDKSIAEIQKRIDSLETKN